MNDARELLDVYGADRDQTTGHAREEYAPKTFDALRAVLDLHKPLTLDGTTFCLVCRPGGKPCKTVTAITAELEKS